MKIIALFLTILVSVTLYAEQITCNGTVRNKNGELLPFATVALYRSADSALVASALANENGSYNLTEDLTRGVYELQFSYVGVTPETRSVDTRIQNTFTHDVELAPMQNIDEVAIVAQKNVIEHQADRIQVHVGNSSLNTGSSALAVLEKSPGVVVNKQDGGISLMGKSDVMVMINNRPTRMSQAEVVRMLEGMQSNNLETIEIITSPPAKYEAEGAGGIINIITKKKESEGVKATVTAGAGVGAFLQHNEGATVYISKGKIAWFGGVDYAHKETERSLGFVNSGQNISMATDFYRRTAKENILFRTGADIYATDKITLGISADGGASQSDMKGWSYAQALTGTEVDSLLQQDIEADKTAEHIHGTLDAEYKFAKQGNTLSLSCDYFNQSTTDALNYDGNASAGEIVYRQWQLANPAQTDVSVLAGGADATFILPASFAGEAGIKNTTVLIDYSRRSMYSRDGQTQQSGTLFDYQEQIYAGYVSVKKSIKQKWKVKAGLRAEFTVTDAQDENQATIIDSSYGNIFPSVFVMRPLSQKHMVKMAYTKRISRPEYDALNPFNYYLDPNSIHTGNPSLVPMISHSVEFGHVYNNWLVSNVFLRYNTDEFNQIAKSSGNAGSVLYVTENIGTSTQIGIFTGGYKQIVKWWGVYANVTATYNETNYTISDAEQTNKQFNYNSYVSSQFFLPKKVKVELSGYYQSEGVSGIYTFEPLYFANITIAKTFGKANNFIVTASVDDLFDTKKVNGKGKSGDMRIRVAIKEESRFARVSLTWNIGNNKLKKQREKESLIGDEQNRLKKGRG